MKILFFCKRRPLAKDLLERPYGRFYYLPTLLAERGHDVYVALLSYKRDPETAVTRDSVHWSSVSVINKNPLEYVTHANRLVSDIQPDWICGFSDTYFGILAQRLGQRYGINSLIDAYDNFESYIPWLKPLHHQWRKSLSKATLVTAAGPELAGLLGQHRPGKPTVVVPMAADPDRFKPMDQTECRQQLGLPPEGRIIGYCGSISSSRGINTLFTAYEELRREQPDLELLLCGRKDRGIALPKTARWFRYAPDETVPVIFNSLDMLAVINKTSAFGNFSYPVKLYEAMCCHVPVVATETPSTRWILRNHRELLVRPDDAGQLCQSIRRVSSYHRMDYGRQPEWQTNCDLLENALTAC